MASESDSWYVTTGIKESYNSIVREVDDWRKKATTNRSKGVFASLFRRNPETFKEEKAEAPRLYRVKDEELGEMSFEFTEVEGGGTSVKSTYNYKAMALIQDLKAKMPIRIPSTAPRNCPACGREMLPDFVNCPYCGTKLR